MRRIVIICLLLIVSVLLVISPARAASWTAHATKLDLLAGPGATAAFLAPDGSRFAYFKGDDLCIYSIAGEKGDCLTLDKDINIDLDSVRWSPDSTKLAFSENFIITFRDSDIWLYDTETNKVTDLTPLRNRKLNLLTNSDSKVIYTIDLIPQWSSDSQSIYFIRYEFNKLRDAYPHLFKVGLKDQKAEEITAMDSPFPVSIYGFAVSPDESQIAYLRDTQNSQEKDGTWYLDLKTKQSKFGAAPVQETAPWSYQFSSDGSLLLSIGVDKTGAIGARPPEASPVYTLPVSGGRQQQLSTESYVGSAGWGPEGSQLAYTTYDPKNPDKQGLYITDAPGRPGEMVLLGRFITPEGRGRTPIFWAANNMLLLSEVPDLKLTVVQLSQS